MFRLLWHTNFPGPVVAKQSPTICPAPCLGTWCCCALWVNSSTLGLWSSVQSTLFQKSPGSSKMIKSYCHYFLQRIPPAPVLKQQQTNKTTKTNIKKQNFSIFINWIVMNLNLKMKTAASGHPRKLLPKVRQCSDQDNMKQTNKKSPKSSISDSRGLSTNWPLGWVFWDVHWQMCE